MTRRAPGPYSRATALARMDGRTRAARLAKATRKALKAHVGGDPTTAQTVLIDQAVQLKIRLQAMDDRFAASGEQTPHDSDAYIAWANALRRCIGALGIAASPPRAPTLAEHLALAAE